MMNLQDFGSVYTKERSLKTNAKRLKIFLIVLAIIIIIGLIVAIGFLFYPDKKICSPYYPEKGCICVTKELSCGDFDEMYNTILNKINSLRPSSEDAALYPSYSFQAGKLVAGMLRLAFHDAAEYDKNSKDKFRSDGCINTLDAGNNGLQRIIDILDELWIPFCPKISRADFWYLAAKVALENSNPYTDIYNKLGTNKNFDASYNISNFNIPFYYGRIDVTNCSYQGPSRLPSAEGNAKEIQRVFIDNLGLDVRSVVGLMGGHSLGSLTVDESGYSGFWKTRIDIFDTGFFTILVNSEWSKQYLKGLDGSNINQWSRTGSSNIAMLNTDMEMLYDIQPANLSSVPDSCGPYAQHNCVNVSQTYPDLDFGHWTNEFAEGNATTNGQPGSSKWLSVFARAFNQMCTVGYTQQELTCAQCQTPSCEGKCDEPELCQGPQYGYYTPQK